jgi:hypothetical protein
MRRVLALAFVLAAVAAVAVLLAPPKAPLMKSPAAADNISPARPETNLHHETSLRPPGEPGRPFRQVSADHQPQRIQHKDASGLCPLELVHTTQGVITIQRTFTTNGILLKEEAFLSNKPVAIPAQ